MHGISSLNVTENVSLISFKKIPSDLAFISDIFDGLSRDGIVIDMISQTSPLSGNVSISLSCFDSDVVKALKVIGELGAKNPQVKPMVSSGNCKLQLSGEEMRNSYGVFARAISCLSRTPAELLQVTTSEVEISLLISAAHLDDAVSALNKEFGV